MASRRFSTKMKGTSKYNGTVRSCCHHLWNSLGSGPLMFSSLVMLGGQSTALDESLWISPWTVSEIKDTYIRRKLKKISIKYIHINTFPHLPMYSTNTYKNVHNKKDNLPYITSPVLNRKFDIRTQYTTWAPTKVITEKVTVNPSVILPSVPPRSCQHRRLSSSEGPSKPVRTI